MDDLKKQMESLKKGEKVEVEKPKAKPEAKPKEKKIIVKKVQETRSNYDTMKILQLRKLGKKRHVRRWQHRTRTGLIAMLKKQDREMK